MEIDRVPDKNYGDRFRSSPTGKKKAKKGKKKKPVDLTRLDLGDLSKQEAAFRRAEDAGDRFHYFMDMMGQRDYVKG